MNSSTARVVTATIAALGLAGTAAPASAAPPKPVKYQNCAALNQVYAHGVAKNDGVDEVRSGKPVTSFRVYPAAYRKNTHLDRDKDGVACEKK